MSNRRDVLMALPLLGAGWASMQQVFASARPADTGTALAPIAARAAIAESPRPGSPPGETASDLRRRERAGTGPAVSPPASRSPAAAGEG